MLIKQPQAPTVEKKPKELTIHGDTRVDDYYWLNERENPQVVSYLESENSYKDSVMANLKPLQKEIYEEIVGRIKQEDTSVPYFKNGYVYYTRYEEGKEYPVYCRKKGSEEGAEEILLNVNEMAEGHDYYQVASRSISPNNKLMAYGVDTVSRRQYDIFFTNLETGEVYPEVLKNTIGLAVWANDNKTLFYTVKDEQTLRPFQIYKHILGTDPSEDKLLFQEDDEIFNAYVFKTKSDDFIMIGSFATLSSEYRFLDANKPEGEFKILQPREKDHEYSVDHFEDKFYIVTNWEAKNFRLMETSVDATEKENWKEVIAHRPEVLLEGIELFKDFMVLDERKDGLTMLRIMNQKDGTEHYLDFGEQAYLAYTSTNPEFDTKVLRYGYQSMTTPNSTFDYDMETKEKTLLKQQEVLGGFKSEDYATERIWATARDGEKVPISLVYKKGMVKDGQNPLLLYAYGSYGSTIDPYFSASRLSLLDRGFVYAIAHIRGGQLKGRQWYDDGKLLKKKNTFTDYIDCAEYLIAENYTNKEKLTAMGGSAGGLLMGAVVNMRPDLFKGVVAAVPFVDVVTTMLDESIPLTTGEFDEWGNPKDSVYYEYIKSYSPYDNVEAKDYPHMLVTTGLHDSQVQYWEPAKWVAKLRELKTDDNILLLHTNMEAGHGGKSGRFAQYEETAMEYAFLVAVLETPDEDKLIKNR
ncbi:S9 family peptidase [Flammeovirgaceae bacterium SG7u.111]|nr:S9 family peptidase [Flammeovirgaceae bacterium SG7u.132]WPO35169.1 S9 family peptidase [Flammeovirgaceae bacterium SG7u.111]